MITEQLLSKNYKFRARAYPYALTPAQESARELFLEEIHNKNKYVRLAFCPYCGNDGFTKISEIDRHGLPSEIAICNFCDGCFKTSILDAEANRFFYENISYILRGKSLSENEIEKLFWKRVKTFAYERYRFICNFLELNPSEDFIVEFGCNDGANLYPWHERGFRIMGLDLDSRIVDFGQKKGLNLKCQDLLKYDFADKKPGLIILVHVLEHVTDVNTVLKKIFDTIEPEGYVFIEVPGIKVQGLGNVLKYFDAEHNYYFNLSNLRRLLEKHGFRIIYGDEFSRILCTPVHNTVPRLCRRATLLFTDRIKTGACRLLLDIMGFNKKRLYDLFRQEKPDMFKAKVFGRLQRSFFKSYYNSSARGKRY